MEELTATISEFQKQNVAANEVGYHAVISKILDTRPAILGRIVIFHWEKDVAHE